MDIDIPEWLDDYLERLPLLHTLVNWLKEGREDQWIADQWKVSVGTIHGLRCRWHLFRADECPDCGSKDYMPATDKGKGHCPERRCFSNWVPLALAEIEKRKKER